ncbi:CoA transferase [Cnuibacter physcomitrellae]|uniref:CaiB/BaiF CoA transferase family protein n=1 Tax=Cnuibacter physcomitrellae TaxID=1619308 RepID=UPI0021758B1D|nr:CoA transferase [Cnuibacter physcomitrellae]MCS5498496.1 CoA transferase [Cnuibacter physcomitrellae]
MSGPLAGLVVADFTRVLAGPYATMMLADMGAEVVKVERLGVGDETRAWTPPVGPTGLSTYFGSVNRNKRSIAVDLADPADRAVVTDLVAHADVVIENFRPGTMDRHGLGPADVETLNPRAVYCSISGFGSGPGAELPGFDLLVQAMGGLMSITGADAQHPTKVGVALVDVVTGLHALSGILAALHVRETTGRGQRIEVDLLSSLLSSLTNQAGAHLEAGRVPQALGNQHPSIAPYETYSAADRDIAIAVGTDAQFAQLAADLGLPQLTEDERFATNSARVAHRAELNARLAPAFAERTAEEWTERLGARGVPAGPINSVPDAFALAERLGLDPVVELAGSRSVANPIRFSATPVEYVSAPPTLPDRSATTWRDLT